jgi:hypothetical protein
MSKLDFNKIKQGEKMSFTNYVTVDKIDKKSEMIEVTAVNGSKFLVKGKELIEGFHSNSQFQKTEKLGMNALAEKLQTAGDKIFTVEYLKADKSKRVLTGHFLSSEANLGRSNVRDLEISTGNSMRQVDHRTIQSIIIDGTKYTK